jgi:uncharacterized protein
MTPLDSLPPLIAGRTSDEYAPVPPGPGELQARATIARKLDESGWSSGSEIRGYLAGRRANATVLRTLDCAAGGGFFAIPDEAEHDTAAADQAFDRGAEPFVIDVQTHLVNPDRWVGRGAEALSGFLRMVDPDRWNEGIDPRLLGAASWAALMFGQSETNIALLTSTPGRASENVLTNAEIAGSRDLVHRYADAKRVLTHTIVHPNLGPAEIEEMSRWAEELRPNAWKVYTLWDPPESIAPGQRGRGWFLDDPAVGIPFLEKVRTTGTKIVCAHKGIGGPIPGASPEGADPRDVGPAAVQFPDITFVIYHSGYEIDASGEEGAYTEATSNRGVNRLVASLAASGVEPGSNVYAEIGSTWYLAVRRPREAAHLLGKLLLAVGENRILWGTDSVWYGSPQTLIDSLWAFQIPADMQTEFGYPALTAERKAKILWQNAAALHNISTTDLTRASSPADLNQLQEIRQAFDRS